MVDFAGWLLPVQFSGLIEEHTAVRERAGLFDVSHMGELAVRGRDALAFLQHVTCNDVARLAAGRAQYTALTTEQGTFVDDLLIYCRGDGDYLLVVNAANTANDLAWLVRHAEPFRAELADESDAWAQLAIQGPLAAHVLRPWLADEASGLRPFRFVERTVERAPCLVSRTGYTGEDGFEIYAPAEAAERIWDALLAAGSECGLVPVGLGARDTLRLEARLALYGQDIDDTTTVIEADLSFIVKPDKEEFLGRDVLVAELARGTRRRLVGFELRGRGIARHGHRALWQGRAVGAVTSGTHSPTLGKSIGLAYLPIEIAAPGSEFEVEVRERAVPAVVVPTPFYKRPS